MRSAGAAAFPSRSSGGLGNAGAAHSQHVGDRLPGHMVTTKAVSRAPFFRDTEMISVCFVCRPAPQSHLPAVLALPGGARHGPQCVCERTNRPAYVRYRTESLAAEGNTCGCEAPRESGIMQAIVQNIGVRTDKGSVDAIDGFLDQINRRRK